MIRNRNRSTEMAKPRSSSATLRPTIMALEPRIMFDGAAVADATEAAADSPQPQNDALPPVIVREADPAVNDGRKEVAFVDTAVTDYQTLVDGVRPGVEVVLIGADGNGLGQMVQWAASHSGYDAIHVLSHGTAGTLRLGAERIASSSLSDAGIQADLAVLGQALTVEGDLLLYGCSIASDADGQAFIANLADATGADVAASIDITGVGGDWLLEARIGLVETVELDSEEFDGRLVTGQAGQVDTSFGDDAMAVISYSSNEISMVGDIYVYQSGGNAGKILTVNGVTSNSNVHTVVNRFNADGSPDTTFSGDGQVVFQMGSGTDTTKAIAVDSNGKIVVAGRTFDGNTYFSVARLNDDGSFDTSFSGDGKFSQDIDGGSINGDTHEVSDMAILSDNTILVAGRSGGQGTIIKLTSAGALDTSFSGDGKYMVDFIPNDNWGEIFDGITVNGSHVYASTYMTGAIKLSRIDLSNGALDTSFGTSGYVTFALPNANRGDAPLFQSDGKIIMSSTSTQDGGAKRSITIFRLNSDGALDTTFGTNDYATSHIDKASVDDWNVNVKLQSDDKILVSSQSSVEGLQVVRFTAAGALDTTFGSNGTKSVIYPHAGLLATSGVKLALNAGGEIFAMGRVTQGSIKNGAVVKLFPVEQTGNMTFGFATAFQDAGVVSREYYRDVIGIVVGTNGEASPLSATSFTFNTTGTTSTADLEKAALYDLFP